MSPLCRRFTINQKHIIDLFYLIAISPFYNYKCQTTLSSHGCCFCTFLTRLAPSFRIGNLPLLTIALSCLNNQRENLLRIGDGGVIVALMKIEVTTMSIHWLFGSEKSVCHHTSTPSIAQSLCPRFGARL